MNEANKTEIDLDFICPLCGFECERVQKYVLVNQSDGNFKTVHLRDCLPVYVRARKGLRDIIIFRLAEDIDFFKKQQTNMLTS